MSNSKSVAETSRVIIATFAPITLSLTNVAHIQDKELRKYVRQNIAQYLLDENILSQTIDSTDLEITCKDALTKKDVYVGQLVELIEDGRIGGVITISTSSHANITVRFPRGEIAKFKPYQLSHHTPENINRLNFKVIEDLDLIGDGDLYTYITSQDECILTVAKKSTGDAFWLHAINNKRRRFKLRKKE